MRGCIIFMNHCRCLLLFLRRRRISSIACVIHARFFKTQETMKEMMKNMRTILFALSAIFFPFAIAAAHTEPCIICGEFNNQTKGGISQEFLDVIRSRTVSVDINAQDRFGRTALFLAARANNTIAVTELIRDLGDPMADPNILDNNGRSVLMWAAEHKNVPMIRVLLNSYRRSKTANPNIIKNDRVALDYVFDTDGPAYDAFIELVNGGARISLMMHESRDLFSALFRARTNSSPDLFSVDGFFRQLVDAGGDVSAVDNALSQSALVFAASSGALDLTEELIDHGVSCNVADSRDKFPADYAFEELHADVLEYLHALECSGGVVSDTFGSRWY